MYLQTPGKLLTGPGHHEQGLQQSKQMSGEIVKTCADHILEHVLPAS